MTAAYIQAMSDTSLRSSVVSAMMTKVSKKAEMKKVSILTLSLKALVNMRLVGSIVAREGKRRREGREEGGGGGGG